ncbi:unnamed protein product [Trypanosoma congolense IL3000]|uniref:WGS project CAEQ00000000 data, annotated contig 2072 n=1 Tax=Trypanosoma congolense (strain IL3000) TaxID=1068625 RepID=F9WB77_TRYCI|nr:unnamed protein product [Trypanosoma congolense IL3000]
MPHAHQWMRPQGLTHLLPGDTIGSQHITCHSHLRDSSGHIKHMSDTMWSRTHSQVPHSSLVTEHPGSNTSFPLPSARQGKFTAYQHSTARPRGKAMESALSKPFLAVARQATAKGAAQRGLILLRVLCCQSYQLIMPSTDFSHKMRSSGLPPQRHNHRVADMLPWRDIPPVAQAPPIK